MAVSTGGGFFAHKSHWLLLVMNICQVFKAPSSTWFGLLLEQPA